MRARPLVLAVSVLLTVLTLAGCAGGTGTSRSTRCVNGTCTISLSGEQRFEVEIGRFERDMRVGPIAPTEVTVSVRGAQAVLGPGESATLGGLAVTVDSIAGRDVQLQVRRA